MRHARAASFAGLLGAAFLAVFVACIGDDPEQGEHGLARHACVSGHLDRVDPHLPDRLGRVGRLLRRGRFRAPGEPRRHEPENGEEGRRRSGDLLQVPPKPCRRSLAHGRPTRRWCVRHVLVGVPARSEPNVGELNYEYLFKLLDELKYDGWIGCEYRPAGNTAAGLGWLYKLIDRRPASAA